MPRDYHLIVDSPGNDDVGAFALDVTAIAWRGRDGWVLNDSCDSPQELAFQIGRRVQLDGSTLGARDDLSPAACGNPGAGGQDVVYLLDLDVPSHLTATLISRFAGVLYIRDGAGGCVNGEQLHRLDGSPARIVTREALPAGRYYIVVDMEFADAEPGPRRPISPGHEHSCSRSSPWALPPGQG